MKAYTLMSGRPIGRHPTIYLYKPFEMLDPEWDTNPWSPHIEEWESPEKAFTAIFNFCDDKQYRNEITIKSEPDNE